MLGFSPEEIQHGREGYVAFDEVAEPLRVLRLDNGAVANIGT
ncbi:MAG: hypothetical protein AB1486_32610 [Planctomycetota bacterium]